MKEKVTFETNVPVSSCLAQSRGNGGGGPLRATRSCTTCGWACDVCTVSIRDQMRKLDVKPGERFQVCKREVQATRRGLHRVDGEPKGRQPGSQSAFKSSSRKLESAGLVVTGCSRLSNHTGWQLCCAGGEVVNVFDTGRVFGSRQERGSCSVHSGFGGTEELNEWATLEASVTNDGRQKPSGKRRASHQEEWCSQTQLRHANGTSRSTGRHQGGREVR